MKNQIIPEREMTRQEKIVSLSWCCRMRRVERLLSHLRKHHSIGLTGHPIVIVDNVLDWYCREYDVPVYLLGIDWEYIDHKRMVEI